MADATADLKKSMSACQYDLQVLGQPARRFRRKGADYGVSGTCLLLKSGQLPPQFQDLPAPLSTNIYWRTSIEEGRSHRL